MFLRVTGPLDNNDRIPIYGKSNVDPATDGVKDIIK